MHLDGLSPRLDCTFALCTCCTRPLLPSPTSTSPVPAPAPPNRPTTCPPQTIKVHVAFGRRDNIVAEIHVTTDTTLVSAAASSYVQNCVSLRRSSSISVPRLHPRPTALTYVLHLPRHTHTPTHPHLWTCYSLLVSPGGGARSDRRHDASHLVQLRGAI